MSKSRQFKGKSLIDFPDKYVIVDIETTGLSPEWCEIIEISALKVVDGEIIDIFSYLVQPQTQVDDFITELTGITNEMLAKALIPEKIIPLFYSFVEDNIIIGHNVNFDINFLYDECELILNKPLSNDFIDTVRISRKLFPHLEHHRLSDVAAECKITYIDAHRSESDCRITYECWIKMQQLISEKFASTGYFEDLFHDKKHLSRDKRYSQIDCKSILPTQSYFDEEHPFYKKTVVFTGELSKMQRSKAMQLVVNVGGLVSDNLTKKTNYLVVGTLDFSSYAKGHKTNKIIKAEKYVLAGCDISIIAENDFYDIMVIPDRSNEINYFSDESSRLSWLKLNKLTPQTFNVSKQLYYKAHESDKFLPCEVVGYNKKFDFIAIICVNEKEERVHVDFLREMQPTIKEVKSWKPLLKQK